MMKLIYCLIITVVFFLWAGCTHPSYIARKVTFPDSTLVKSPCKVQTKNDSLFYFPAGFYVINDSIKGACTDTLPAVRFKRRSIPVSQIAAIINYEDNTSPARHFASCTSGLSSTGLSLLTIYCVACPKCCFGSCPTIYTANRNEYRLEAELFSECIAKQLEAADLDMLQEKVPVDRVYKIKITNEALETHYINRFNLFSASHPIGTDIFPTINDSFLLMKDYSNAYTAVNSKGLDVSGELQCNDNSYYRSPKEMIKELKKGPAYDHIDITLNSRHVNNPVKMVMKYRNTLLSTTLLYDVVLGSQGINAVEWTNKMNTDKSYADMFSIVYKAFSGIKIKYLKNNQWVDAGRFKDSGPLNWKSISAEIPSSDGTVKIRLEFVPDNFMIDYIAFDLSGSDNSGIEFTRLVPSDSKDILPFIEDDDSLYLQTNPGDSYLLTYNIPCEKGKEQTLFISSKGYYNEWIREKWISENNIGYSFDLFNINETLNYLAESWLSSGELLEAEFFRAKVNLRSAK